MDLTFYVFENRKTTLKKTPYTIIKRSIHNMWTNSDALSFYNAYGWSRLKTHVFIVVFVVTFAAMMASSLLEMEFKSQWDFHLDK